MPSSPIFNLCLVKAMKIADDDRIHFVHLYLTENVEKECFIQPFEFPEYEHKKLFSRIDQVKSHKCFTWCLQAPLQRVFGVHAQAEIRQ